MPNRKQISVNTTSEQNLMTITVRHPDGKTTKHEREVGYIDNDGNALSIMRTREFASIAPGVIPDTHLPIWGNVLGDIVYFNDYSPELESELEEVIFRVEDEKSAWAIVHAYEKM